ncbi:hypothetical protein [Nonomuraea sp. B19D2]
MVRLLEDHRHLVLGSEVGRSRFETGAYGFWPTCAPSGVVEVQAAP